MSRKIYFYRSDAGTDDANEPIPINIRAYLQAIEKLEWQGGQRYVPQGDGNVLMSWIDLGPADPRVKLATSRRTAIPMIERSGDLHELRLDPDEGLCETTHIIFFPNDIVGVEFNFYGPRPSRIGWYIKQACSEAKLDVPYFTLLPILRRDINRQLDHLRNIRLLDLAIRAPYAETVAQTNRDLGSAFGAARQAGAPQVVGLTLEPEPRRRSPLGGNLLATVRSLANQPDLRENAVRFNVKGRNAQTGKTETIDILKDQLISHKEIRTVGARSRIVDDQDAYISIEEAYHELREELEASPTIDVRNP